MNKLNFIGIIVTYNPDIERLTDNIKSISKQVDEIYIFDNCSNNIQEIKKNICGDNLTIYCSNSNKGIAAALNHSLMYAAKSEYSWALQLDQDSIFPENGVENYKKIICIDKSIGIIAPRIVDRNYMSNDYYNNDWEFIDETINSGALINIDVWKKLNGYDENLFLDCVDFDFDRRLLNAGYHIIRANNVELLHELGNTQKISLFGQNIMVYNYSARRKETQLIDQLKYEKKYGRKITRFVINKKVMRYIIIIMFFEKDKINKIRHVLNASTMALQIFKRYH